MSLVRSGAPAVDAADRGRPSVGLSTGEGLGAPSAGDGPRSGLPDGLADAPRGMDRLRAPRDDGCAAASFLCASRSLVPRKPARPVPRAGSMLGAAQLGFGILMLFASLSLFLVIVFLVSISIYFFLLSRLYSFFSSM